MSVKEMMQSNDISFSWGNESPPEVFRKGSLSQLGMGTITNQFRLQLPERLPFKKNIFFSTKDCLLPHKSAGDIFFNLL